MSALVTTAIEKTWGPPDEPIIFLGEWCTEKVSSERLRGREYVTAYPLAKDHSERIDALKRIIALTRVLQDELSTAMNAALNLDQSRRYWRIVLGHWLNRWVCTAYHRYQSASEALEKYKPSHTYSLDTRFIKLAQQSSLQYIYSTEDDYWNHAIWVEVLRELGLPIKPIEQARWSRESRGEYEAVDTFVAAKPLPFFKSLLSLSISESSPLIAHTGMSRGQNVLLHLFLGILPKFWPVYPTEPQAEWGNRSLLLPGFGANCTITGFEGFVRRLLPRVLPLCFLEGHRPMRNSADELGYPRRPKFIFTATSFDTDEQLKVYAALNVDRGTPYFVGQHGNNYGTHFFSGSRYWPERETPNEFLSWGWTQGDAMVTPTCITNAHKIPEAGNELGTRLLMMTSVRSHMWFPWDVFSLHQQESEFEHRTLQLLGPLTKYTVVRIHPATLSNKQQKKKSLAEKHPLIEVDIGDTNLTKLMRSARLVLFCYDSTGLLQCLAKNRPAIAVWPNGLEHVEEDARPYYETLIDCGIVHLSPESAAQKIREVWDDVYRWWLSSLVQSRVASFCDKYAKGKLMPSWHIAKTLRDLTDEANARS